MDTSIPSSKPRPSSLEVLFVLFCALLVVVIAIAQLSVVVGLQVSSLQPMHFILPLWVGGFFGTLLVVIVRLRNGLKTRNEVINRLNRELESDLAKAGRQLETAQRELEHGERLRVMGLLGAQIAHDFRNLLTAIQGSVDLIRVQDTEDKLSVEADIIDAAAERAGALSNRLLTFSKPTQDNSTTDMSLALAEMVPILRKLTGEKVKLEVIEGTDCSHAAVDRGQMEVCLLNLVVNAIDAVDEGVVTIETEPRDTWVVVTVNDTGKGMDEDTLAHAFEPFFTTKNGGTGLGLAVVRDAIERAGGKLEISSTVGEGTSVSLLFPARLDS